MLEQLKALNCDRADTDELISLSAMARVLTAEFTILSIPLPEWLQDATRTVRSEITLRQRDAREKRLKDIRRQQEGLKTTEEKRASLAQEAAELELMLK